MLYDGFMSQRNSDRGSRNQPARYPLEAPMPATLPTLPYDVAGRHYGSLHAALAAGRAQLAGDPAAAEATVRGISDDGYVVEATLGRESDLPYGQHRLAVVGPEHSDPAMAVRYGMGR